MTVFNRLLCVLAKRDRNGAIFRFVMWRSIRNVTRAGHAASRLSKSLDRTTRAVDRFVVALSRCR